ncbi:Uncharacterized protein HZ326_28091, partial [Fusarium oxysporum f. sp. albedinis]
MLAYRHTQISRKGTTKLIQPKADFTSVLKFSRIMRVCILDPKSCSRRCGTLHFVHPHLADLPRREPTVILAYRLPPRDPEPSLHRQRSCGNFIQLGVYSESQLASRRWCWGRQSHQPNNACATSGLLLPHRPYSQRPIKSRHILIHLLYQAAQLMLSTDTWLLGSIRAGKTHKMMPPRPRRRQGRWLY